MQSSGRYEICSRNEKESLLDYLEEKFGIPREIFKDYTFLKKGKNVWIFSGDLEALSEVRRIEIVGIKALSPTKSGLKPTTTFVQIFGKFARKNVVELKDENELIEFASGGIVKRKFNAEPGYVIVKYGDDILGCGLYSHTGLISQIPRGRRVEEKWFKEQ